MVGLHHAEGLLGLSSDMEAEREYIHSRKKDPQFMRPRSVRVRDYVPALVSSSKTAHSSSLLPP